MDQFHRNTLFDGALGPFIVLEPGDIPVDAHVDAHTDVGTATVADYATIAKVASSRRCVFVIGSFENLRDYMRGLGLTGDIGVDLIERGLYSITHNGTTYLWTLPGIRTNFDVTIRGIALRLASFVVVFGSRGRELVMFRTFWNAKDGNFPPVAASRSPGLAALETISSGERANNFSSFEIIDAVRRFAEDEEYVDISLPVAAA